MNITNWLTEEYVVKDLFGILVYVTEKIVMHVNLTQIIRYVNLAQITRYENLAQFGKCFFMF